METPKLTEEQLLSMRDEIIKKSYILRNHPPEPQKDKNCKAMNLTKYVTKLSLPSDANKAMAAVAISELPDRIAESIDDVVKNGNEDFRTGLDCSPEENLLGVKDSLLRNAMQKSDLIRSDSSCDISFTPDWVNIYPHCNKQAIHLSIPSRELKFYLFLSGIVSDYNISRDCIDITAFYNLGWTFRDALVNLGPTYTKQMKDLDKVLNMQLSDPASKTDPYMQGMANGMLVAKGIFSDEDVCSQMLSLTPKKSWLSRLFA